MRVVGRRRGTAARVIAVAASLAAALPAAGGAQPPSLTFGAPVLVGPPVASTWEPTMLIDRFGNIFITARKDTTQLVVAPDPRSPTLTRSMSWLWTSGDGGGTFDDIHGYPLDVENHDWGYEADIALDGAGHLFMADQNYLDSTMTRWTIAGLGSYAIDFHRPLVPTAQPVDDRPWLAAHGDGTVLYAAQAGAPQLNPFGRDGGPAYGKGRYSVYHSTNGGSTFDLIGRSLNESGGCRPAADPRPGSRVLYVVCTNDGGAQGLLESADARGKVWAYVSEDDGASYARYQVGGYNGDTDTFDWPLVAVGPNRDVWVLHIDSGVVDHGAVLTNVLNLYHSSDLGRTWSRQDITPEAGRYRWGALTISPQGDIALAIQHRASTTAAWRVYASVFSPGSIPTLTSVDEQHPVSDASNPDPPSELIGLAYAPDGALCIAWTRVQGSGTLRKLHVYFSRSLP
jgi:hypothetical protein